MNWRECGSGRGLMWGSWRHSIQGDTEEKHLIMDILCLGRYLRHPLSESEPPSEACGYHETTETLRMIMHLSAGTMLRLGSMFHATGASGMTYYLYPYQYPASTSKSMQPARHPASQLGTERERERELGRGTAGRGVKFTQPPNSCNFHPWTPITYHLPQGFLPRPNG